MCIKCLGVSSAGRSPASGLKRGSGLLSLGALVSCILAARLTEMGRCGLDGICCLSS